MATQPLNIPEFRKLFPQFADPAQYPDATIQAVYNVAGSFIDDRDSPCRVLHGKQLALAMQYLTAHLLATQIPPANGSSTPGGGGTGEMGESGFITSATIGDISVSKLAPPAKDGWEFWLAGSPYGVALWALLGILAVGGLSVGGLPEREGFRKWNGVFW